MRRLSDIRYSREECISAVRDYYKFIVGLYLHESEIIEPPAEGWPDITTATMQAMGKTDEVISLLRHLPYIRFQESGFDLQGAPWCVFADWQSSAQCIIRDPARGEHYKLLSEGVSIYENVPPHVISLTQGPQDNEVFLIDTELGIAIWFECPGQIKFNPSRELVDYNPNDYPEAEVDWRADSAAWTIPDFFEVLKDQFRQLKFFPTGRRESKHVYARPGFGTEGMVEMLQGIYRAHGWPDMDKYRKEDCLRAVYKALKEHYPGNEDMFGPEHYVYVSPFK
ncbi:hypothetical protein V8C42DRAFT_313059 [Trichoderma barbatum]